jgi:hypothetical protein
MIDNALLHLYGRVSATSRYVPVVNRNKLVNDKQPILPEIIYILADHIEHCFSDEGKQIAPVSLLIETTRLTVLLNAIERYPAFSYELHEWNEQTKQAHILLHPQP